MQPITSNSSALLRGLGFLNPKSFLRWRRLLLRKSMFVVLPLISWSRNKNNVSPLEVFRMMEGSVRWVLGQRVKSSFKTLLNLQCFYKKAELLLINLLSLRLHLFVLQALQSFSDGIYLFTKYDLPLFTCSPSFPSPRSYSFCDTLLHIFLYLNWQLWGAFNTIRSLRGSCWECYSWVVFGVCKQRGSPCLLWKLL